MCEFRNPAADIVAIGIELLTLKGRIENPEIGCSIGTRACDPLPVGGIAAGMGLLRGFRNRRRVRREGAVRPLADDEQFFLGLLHDAEGRRVAPEQEAAHFARAVAMSDRETVVRRFQQVAVFMKDFAAWAKKQSDAILDDLVRHG